jgi:chromatin modification-related protein EAF6
MELETQIYNSETNYIVETANTGGNILQGFENYLKAGTSSRKRVEILETDRIFSHSSSSAQRVCLGVPVRRRLTRSPGIQSLNRLEDDSAVDDQYGVRASGTPGIQTVSIAPATRAQEAQAAQKRERDRLYQRKKRASMRQSTISDDGEALPPRKRRKFAED